MRRAPVDLAEFRRLHDQGMGAEPLAQHFKISPERARQIRRKLGVEPHDNRLRGDDLARMHAASARYDAGGITMAAAARAHGISPDALSSWRRNQQERERIAADRARRLKEAKVDDACRERSEALIAAWDRRREAARRAAGIAP